ncbi:MAG TPA: methyltransferase domain-containing protein [Fimbriimonadaceae bacterium]|nr:methyltransferase domain-containing protein [Fimbriimonadaceae bacterium]
MIRSILPPKAYDALRRTSKEVKLATIYKGDAVECFFCGNTFSKFKPHGIDVPILSELQVVSGGVRDTTCPRCGSYDRERLLYLFVERRTDLLSGGKKVLDIAPADNLGAKIKASPGIDYTSGDLLRTDVMVKLDVTDIQFPDETFDAVMCNHVMEHVPDDRKAMREIRRVLKPGGWALVLVPYSKVLKETIEDPTAATPEERLRRFGQDDHIRIYALPDYLARLRESGLEVEVIPFVSQLDPEEVRRYALIGETDIILARRPA